MIAKMNLCNRPPAKKKQSGSATGITPPQPQPVLVDEPLPYMRSASVTFTGKGLKPNTRVYPFFDGEDVSDHCRDSSGSDDFGEALVTDNNGEIVGVFRIPPETYKTGSRLFVLTNSSTDPTAETDCYAVAKFTSYGTITYDTGKIASTRSPEITFARANSPRELSVERTVTIDPSTTTFKDPIAQTFFVSGNPNGIFATKVDVYFRTRPTDATVPITLQIRTTTNGNPGQEILPFSTVTLYPKDVNVSEDASAATQFRFASPVYLSNEEEYAIVLLPAGGRSGYEVWTAELGETKIGTDEVIDKQPSAGRLYVSSNSVNWTVSETKDMKFTVYNANFTNSSGVLYLKNKKIDYQKFSSATVDVKVGDVFTGATSTATGTVLAIDVINDVAQVEVSGSTLFQDGETVNIKRYSGGSNVGTATISLEPYTVGVEGKVIHELNAGISYVEYNDSSIQFEHKIYDSAETDPGSYSKIKKAGIFTLGEEKTVYSYSYERDAAGLNISDDDLGSVMVKATLNTTNNNISPVIDITKSQVIGYRNYIRANRRSISGTHSCDNTSLTPAKLTGSPNAAYFDHVIKGAVLRDAEQHVVGVVRSITAVDELEFQTSAYKNLASQPLSVDYEATDVRGNTKYHTKIVELTSSNYAEDLMIFLDANIPSGTAVDCYVRVLAPGDTSDIESRPWVLMNKILNNNTLGAGEYVYKFRKNGHDENTVVGGLNSNGVYQYTTTSDIAFTGVATFAIKIVLESYDSYYKPEVFSMRALALQA